MRSPALQADDEHQRDRMLLSRCRQTSICNQREHLPGVLYDEVSISAKAHMTRNYHAFLAQNLPKHTAIYPILMGKWGELGVLRDNRSGNKKPAKSLTKRAF
jgi:hypothetical protein